MVHYHSKLCLDIAHFGINAPSLCCVVFTGNSYMHFLIETKKSELDKMCVINVVVIAYKNINYYKSSGLK